MQKELDVEMTDTLSPAEPGFRDYGAASVRRALASMLVLSESVRERADDEAVHDMRVASRRLRAALNVFEPAFRGRRFERFRKHVKRLTDSLSRARDLDVMIEAVRQLADEMPDAERGGISAYRDRLIADRDRLQPKVRQSLLSLESADLEAEFDAIANDTGASDTDPAQREGDLRDEFSFVIHSRIRDIRSWERYIFDVDKVHELHQMRIAAKRLRYTMELFHPFCGEEFTKATDQIRRIQEYLGKIHDADVIVPALLVRLRRNLRQIDELDPRGVYASDSAAQKGLITAAMLKRAEREDQYRKFKDYWRKIQDTALLNQILRITQEVPEAGRGQMG